MRILHFILGKANKDRANGVNQVIAGICKYTARSGADIRVIGKAETVKHEGELIQRDGFSVEVYSNWSKQLITALNRDIIWADIVHLHGAYSIWNLFVARMSDKLMRPYVITLHNGLAPKLAQNRNGHIKNIYHHLFQKNHINKAAGIQVLTEEEATDLLSISKPQYVFCIPNGVDKEDYPTRLVHKISNTGVIKIGYLGRFSAEKNLESLCAAFINLKDSYNIRLLLAGPETNYSDGLKKKYETKGIEFVGGKYNQEKVDFIQSLDLFVHPSLSEGFSISVVEVLAIGTPLLITRSSKMGYYYDRNAFFMCEPTQYGLERGIKLALNSKSNWESTVINGRKLVDDLLNWEVIAGQMLNVYSELLYKKNEA